MTRKVLFTTQRLKLVDFSKDHLDGLADMNADPEVMRYFPAPLNRWQSEVLLEHIMAHRRQYGFSLMALYMGDERLAVQNEEFMAGVVCCMSILTSISPRHRDWLAAQA